MAVLCPLCQRCSVAERGRRSEFSFIKRKTLLKRHELRYSRDVDNTKSAERKISPAYATERPYVTRLMAYPHPVTGWRPARYNVEIGVIPNNKSVATAHVNLVLCLREPVGEHGHVWTRVHRDYVGGGGDGIIGKCITDACPRADLNPCTRDALSMSALNGLLPPRSGLDDRPGRYYRCCDNVG